MVKLLYTTLYVLCFQLFDGPIDLYIIMGIGANAIVSGIMGCKIRFFNYLKMFDINLDKDNYFELISVILFLLYYYYRLDILANYNTIITFPSLVILIFYTFLQVDYDK